MHFRAVLLGMIVASPVAAGDWTGWRGPAGNGVSDETKLPIKWSATEHVRWKAPLLGVGVSAPVVFGDRVIITASDGRLS